MARLPPHLEDFFYRPDEDVGPLEALALGPEAPPAGEPEEVPGEFLAFFLEDECYAVPLTRVREVLKVPPLTEVPRGGPHLLGVMSLRGEVMPVYDVKVRLHLASAPPRVAGPEAPAPPRAARILVVSAEEGPAGVWVDRVEGVVRLLPSSLEAPPPGVGGGERGCVVGLGRREGRLYILLDLEEALA